MKEVLQDSALILVFILLSGLFVAAELALVSLREGQLRGLAGRGRRGKRVADLAAEPNRFLAAVQVGVTVAGFLSAAFGAATLGDKLKPRLVDRGLSEGAASAVAVIFVTLVISYVSIVLGELVPKRLALQRSEGIALVAAPFVDRMARLLRPVIWLLSKSTNGVVRLIGGGPNNRRGGVSEGKMRGPGRGHETPGGEGGRGVGGGL